MRASFDNILDYYAQIHTPFLHGAGLAGTMQLLETADLQGSEELFELGCGTGASLVFLAHNFPQLQLHGGDISLTMLSKAKKRIGFSGLGKRIRLYQLQTGQALPFPNEQFDVLWIESVLAFQDQAILGTLLTELHRILKHGGKLLINETLWLASTKLEERQRINNYCQEHFGMIQARAVQGTVDDWIRLLEEHGFEQKSCAPLQNSEDQGRWAKNMGSTLFDYVGKLKRALHPRFRKDNSYVQQLEAAVFPKGEQVMQAYTLHLQKNQS